ncbi:sigma-70 family RNA polymerase sigma factor [Brachymonas sp. G13]|uniref:sigma-70 family RNA polymerase sigma factor n=1 Tax=Brachymonas wangyanguii TaxID=3130163 RepID=UPI00307F7108
MRITTSLLTDDDCIARAQCGDAAAFAELVRRFQERVYRFLLRLTRTREDAQDLTQETFMHAYEALPRWRPDAQFSTWLLRIARNQAYDMLRRSQRVDFVALEPEHAAQLVDTGPTPDVALQGTQQLQLLDAALGRLPADQREVLLLREIEQLSYDEIAQVLDVPLGTIKSRIARARLALAAAMPP